MQRLNKVPVFLFVLGLINACQNTEEKRAITTREYDAKLKPIVSRDSLINTILDRGKLSASIKMDDLQRLDSISCMVDGEQSESLAMAVSELWKNQFQPVITYLAAHPEGCLRQQLIWGISEDLSVNSNRTAENEAFKIETNKKAEKSRLTVEEYKFLRKLVADIRPEIFD